MGVRRGSLVKGALIVFIFYNFLGFTTSALRNGYTLCWRLSDLNDSGMNMFLGRPFFSQEKKKKKKKKLVIVLMIITE